MDKSDIIGFSIGGAICDTFCKHAEKNGYRNVDRSNLLVKYLDDNKSLFNYSGAHQYLVPTLLSQTPAPKDKISVVDQCIRTADAGIIGISPSHLLSFTMAVFGGFGHITDKKAEEYFHIKNMVDFLQASGIDKGTLRFSICAGGQYLDKQVKPDIDSRDILLSLGVKPEHIVANKGRTNFMLSQGMNRPSGYNIEIYKEHKGQLLEIASSNIYEFLNKEVYLQETTNKGIGVGFGIDRLEYVVKGLDSVYDTEFYQTVKNKLSEQLGINETQTKMILDKIYRITEVGKTIALAINDGQEFDKSPRGRTLKSYLAKNASELAFLDIDHEKFLEILKPALAKKYNDPIFNVKIDDKAYDVYGNELKAEYDKKLGKRITPANDNTWAKRKLERANKHGFEVSDEVKKQSK